MHRQRFTSQAELFYKFTFVLVLSMLSALTLFAISSAQRSCTHSGPPFAAKQSEIIIFEGLLRDFWTQFGRRKLTLTLHYCLCWECNKKDYDIFGEKPLYHLFSPFSLAKYPTEIKPLPDDIWSKLPNRQYLG